VSGGITGEVGTVAGTEDGTVAGTEDGMAEVGTEVGAGTAAVGAGTAAVPATVFTEAPSWATVAHPAIGVARGVTAATRRSTEGIRTDRGIRPRGKRPVRRRSEPGCATRPFTTRRAQRSRKQRSTSPLTSS
jgi:hypothetical protein